MNYRLEYVLGDNIKINYALLYTCNHDIINVSTQVNDSSTILFQTVSVDVYLMYDYLI